jgi:hypothetical protein
MITSRIWLTSRNSALFRPSIGDKVFLFLFDLLFTIIEDTFKIHKRHPCLAILIPAVVAVAIELPSSMAYEYKPHSGPSLYGIAPVPTSSPAPC